MKKAESLRGVAAGTGGDGGDAKTVALDGDRRPEAGELKRSILNRQARAARGADIPRRPRLHDGQGGETQREPTMRRVHPRIRAIVRGRRSPGEDREVAGEAKVALGDRRFSHITANRG